MKTALLVIIAVVLALFGISGWAFWFMQRSATQKTISDLQTKSAASETALADGEKSLAECQTARDQSANDLKDRTASLDKCKVDLRTSGETLKATRDELSDIKGFLICKNIEKYKFDFSSNQKISNSLKEYVGDIDGSVKDADWKTVWNNSRTAYHSVYAEYMYPFVVSYKDESHNDLDIIFDLTNWCMIPGD